MPETYYVDCDCGSQLRVELYHAGTDRACPSCSKSVMIPDSITLREMSGDKYPYLRPIEKVRQTARAGEAPFNGLCHGCNSTQAQFATPCCLTVMEERVVASDGGIRPTLTGVALHTASSEEHYTATSFPLLLCEQCQSRFQSDRFFARLKSKLKLAALLGLLGAFLYFVYYNAEVVAALAGLIWLVGVIAWAAGFRDTKKFPAYLNRWFENIRWLPEAIADEDEFSLTVGQSKAIETI
ncbi:hypothetical protein [Rubinisphaera margarita]|uniref:hypothetical protein n=1 Tax=Rubinisphaera margarita TaxID=2909586 RepID=UPI001EE8C936|nr:hypothetical protein [Rubinisphaera margarita]MCG6155543.1 hypothetical protein [Rubinisphaera margarita]